MATTTERVRTVFETTGHGATAMAFGNVAGAARAFGMAAAAGVGALAGLGAAAVAKASQFETLQKRLDGVMKSGAAGKQAFAWAKEFAKTTPYELTEVVDALTTMTALNLDPMSGALKTLGDAAAATGSGAEGLKTFVMQLGQMKALGKVQMDQLREVILRGVPALDILQKELGVTGDELADMMQKGKLAAKDGIGALLRGMEKMYGGQMAGMMNTIAGKWSNLKDAVAQWLATIGTALSTTIKRGLDVLTAWFNNPKNIEAGVRFAATIAAALETGWEFAVKIVRTFAAGQGIPAWLGNIAITMLEILKYGVAWKATMTGMTVGALFGPIGAAVGGLAGLFAGAYGAGKIGDVQNNIRGQIAAGQNTWGGFGQGMDGAKLDFQTRRDKYTRDAMANLAPGGSMPPPRREQPTALPPPPVKLDGGKELEAFAQRVWGTMWRRMLEDPKQRAYLKAALAAGGV